MNCIILNSFPIMCFKGASVLATFLCLNGSLLDQLSCIIFICSTCTYSEIYVYISVCLSVHLRELGGLICHSTAVVPIFYKNMNACSMIRVCCESRWRWFMRGLMWP